MAEFVFKALARARGLEGCLYAESAAVSDEELGNPIYPPARRCLSQHGVWFDSGKTARTVVPADYGRFDLIVCMDRSNLRWLKRIFGDDPEGKVRLMMEFAMMMELAIPSGNSVRSGSGSGSGPAEGAGSSASAASRGSASRSESAFLRSPSVRDVADPWYTGDFEQTFQDILRGCEGLLREYGRRRD